MTRRPVIVAGVLLAACLPAAAGGGDPNAALVRQLDRMWSRLDPPRPTMSCRGLFDFALEAAAAGARLGRIDRALALAEQMQDRDPASRTYGNLKWYWRDEKPDDRNAVEFCMQKGILLWMLHKAALDDQATRRLQRLITFSIEGIRRHSVSESYTNIFLMKTFNCIAIGESTGRDQLADEGYHMLDAWLVCTAENGIREYLSPTYYGVDLDSLGLIARLARRGEGRTDAAAALRLFWTDIAANWLEPCARLGGAHSRDYDYLTGHGYLDHHLRLAGWIRSDPPYVPSAFLRLCRWDPPADTLRGLAGKTPRMVRQRWGAAPGQTAAHYVGRSVSIGSAGANYGPMDKPLAINFAGGAGMPIASFFMDARDDPYGSRKFVTGGGHSKAQHITYFLASVQRGPEVLLLASADPNSPGFKRFTPAPTCLLSHIILPAAVDAWIADRPFKPKAGERVEVPPGEAVFLRFQDAAVGLRFVAALDASGQAAPVALIADGGDNKAMRLTCTHSPTSPRRRGTVALWARAAEGLDEPGFASFRRAFAARGQVKADGDRLDVSVGGLTGRLRLAVDLAKGERLAVEGEEDGAADCLLAVDGRDVGREILNQVSVIARYRRMLEQATAGTAPEACAGEPIEAEAAAMLIHPFVVAADATASGGKFVWVPGEPGQGGGSAVARAAWPVHVPKPGRYWLWARVQTPTPDDDSFLLAVRQAGRAVLGRAAWHTGVHKQWQWVQVKVGEPAQPLELALQAGAAVVEFYCRENGARLDALLLTPDANWRPASTRAD